MRKFKILQPLSPYTLTLTLAYCHYYKPSFLPRRSLSLAHLRVLSSWLDLSKSGANHMRQYPAVAINLAVAHAADLLTVARGVWEVEIWAFEWLQTPKEAQVTDLIQLMVDRSRLQRSIKLLHLDNSITTSYQIYTHQQLTYQQDKRTSSASYASWYSATNGTDEFRLHLPPNMAPYLLFHLLQMGDWSPQYWHGTSYTIAMAAQNGYSLSTMTHIFETATDAPLTLEQQHLLSTWHKQHTMYRIEPIYLLTVQEPSLLSTIRAKRRLNKLIGRQLSPRHAVVSPEIIDPLRRQLKKENIPLNAPNEHLPMDEMAADIAYVALAVKVLEGLSQQLGPLIPRQKGENPYTADLSPTIQANVEQKAQKIIESVVDAIRGRDRFVPRHHSVQLPILAMVEKALTNEQWLQIDYQAIVDSQPISRLIEPLWLEEKGPLAYLHAYCHLAEAERTFRLDRISKCEQIAPNSLK